MHWLYAFWYNYAYPSLKGNGPEDGISTLTKGAVALSLLPVLRKILREEFAAAHRRVMGIESEVKKIERDLAKPLRWVWQHLKQLPKVRLTVKEKTVVTDIHDTVAHDAAAVQFPPPVPTDGTVAP